MLGFVLRGVSAAANVTVLPHAALTSDGAIETHSLEDLLSNFPMIICEELSHPVTNKCEAVEPVPAGTARALLAVMEANSSISLEKALRPLCNNARDLQALVKAVAKHVLVIVGPAGARWWQRSHTQGAPENHYVNVVCAFYSSFCLHASCERAHVAFIELKQISLTQATMPRRKQTRELAEDMPEVNIVLPGLETLPTTGIPSAPARQCRAEAAPSSKGLKTLLESCNATNFLPLFTIEQIGVPELLDLDFASLRAVLPRVPAGLLLRVHKAAQAQILDGKSVYVYFMVR